MFQGDIEVTVLTTQGGAEELLPFPTDFRNRLCVVKNSHQQGEFRRENGCARHTLVLALGGRAEWEGAHQPR